MADAFERRPIVAALVAAMLLAVIVVTAYHLGKNCGAWEAKHRLIGESPPVLCFDDDGERNVRRRARGSDRR
jgi:hypothetical protein